MLCFHQFESREEPALLCWCCHSSQFYCPGTRALLSVRHFLDVLIPLQVSGKKTKFRADLGLILR